MNKTDTVSKHELHKGHRQRMRKRFEQSDGLSSFSEHEVLEMLLFPLVPRRNTNEIAHELLNRFLTLSNVLGAKPEELASVKGLSHSAALGLSLIGQTVGYISEQELIKLDIRDKKALNSSLLRLFRGESSEIVKAICIDNGYGILRVDTVSEGGSASVSADIRKLLRLVLNSRCRYVILVHNHPDDNASFSGADIRTTNRLANALELMGTELIDHVLVCGQKVISMAESCGILRGTDDKISP